MNVPNPACDLNAIKTGLFTSSKLRARILHDYGVTLLPKDANEFANAVISQFDQAPAPVPLEQTLNNADVFRAAVKALASNGRAWATFLKFERRLADLLGGYDPCKLNVGNLARARIRRGDRSGDVAALLRTLIATDTRPSWVAWAKERLALLTSGTGEQ